MLYMGSFHGPESASSVDREIYRMHCFEQLNATAIATAKRELEGGITKASIVR